MTDNIGSHRTQVRQMGLRRMAVGASFMAVATGFAGAADAKPVCGWYAIVSCSSSKAEAEQVANGGWGQVIETSKYKGLKPGLYCVASGPQPKTSAARDRSAAIAQGLSAATYIKRACTDAANIGD